MPAVHAARNRSELPRQADGFFGSKSLKEFCKDYSLDLPGIQNGKPEALTQLAALTGADAAEMIRHTPVRVSQAFMSICGETFHTMVNPRYLVRACPVCAAEDIAANPGVAIDQAVYTRSEWNIAVVDTCHLHQVKLASYAARYSTTERFDIGYEKLNLLEELDSIVPEPAVLDPAQMYVLGRLGLVEHTPSPFLDGVPLFRALQLQLAAGRDLLHRRGVEGPLTDLGRLAAGFEMLGHGREGLDRCIVEMRDGLAAAEMATRIMPRLLEYMHESVALERNLGGFEDVLAATIFRLMHYKSGQVVLGRVCQEATLYHFREACRVYDMQPSYMHAFIAGTPGLATKAGPGKNNYLIDRAVADPILIGRAPLLNSTEVLRHMGRKRTYANRVIGELVTAGIIAPEAGAIHGAGHPIYSLPAVERDIAAFISRFDPVDAEGADMISVDAVSASFGVTSAGLWKLLASGRVKSLGVVPGLGFLTCLRVDVNELVGAITGIEDPVRTEAVATRLGVNPVHVHGLVAGGYLPRAPGNPLVKNKLLHVFSAKAIEAFDAEFISQKALKMKARDPFALGVAVGSGLVPAIVLDVPNGRSQARTVFYNRAQAEALLA